MERNLKPTGLLNLLIALAAAGVGTFIARASASVTDEVVSVFLGLGLLVALFSYFQMRMEAREKLEKLELDELAKSARSTTLFEGTDAEAFPARRAREQFERWLVPAFCFVLLALQVAAAIWLVDSPKDCERCCCSRLVAVSSSAEESSVTPAPFTAIINAFKFRCMRSRLRSSTPASSRVLLDGTTVRKSPAAMC